MDAFQNIAILVVAGTSFWALYKLKQRLDLIEHEVRWVRHEIEDIKRSLFSHEGATRECPNCRLVAAALLAAVGNP